MVVRCSSRLTNVGLLQKLFNTTDNQTMETIKLQDTTVALEGLLTGYTEILEQAKKQLTSYEPTDDVRKSIISSFSTNTDFIKAVAKEVSKGIAQALENEHERELLLKPIVAMTTKAVVDQVLVDELATTVKQAVRGLVTEECVEARTRIKAAMKDCDKEISTMVRRHKEMRAPFAAENVLLKLMEYTDELQKETNPEQTEDAPF